MSESHMSSLGVMHKLHLTSCYGAEAAEVLTGERIPRHPDHLGSSSAYYRCLSISSRGRWFQEKLREIQQLSGVGALTWLREDSPTHEHKQIYRNDAGNVVHTDTHGYTVIKSGWDEDIAAIRQLEDWCRANPDRAGDVLEVGAKWILPAMESRFFTLDPGNEGLGEGDNPEFFFCVLHTIEEMMRFVRVHKDSPYLWVVYHWVMRYGA